MRRKLFLLRLILCRNGYERAEYLKRKKYFYHQGEDCFFIPYNYGTEPYLLSFGDNVYIASGVTFVTHDVAGMLFQSMEQEKKHVKRVGKIEIGNNVFVGANVTILYDVKIGNNVIIAAGAVVNRDVPDNTIFGGVPAKKIGEFTEYIQKNREYSEKVVWFDSQPTSLKKKQQIKYCWGKEDK